MILLDYAFPILLTGVVMADFFKTLEPIIERAIARQLTSPGELYGSALAQHWTAYRNDEDRRIKKRLLRLEGHLQWICEPPGILFKERLSITPASSFDTENGQYSIVYCEDRNEASRALIASVHPEIFGEVVRPAAFRDDEGDFYCWFELRDFSNFTFSGPIASLFRGQLTEEQFMGTSPSAKGNNTATLKFRAAADLYRAYQTLMKDTGWVMPVFSQGWISGSNDPDWQIFLKYRRALPETLDRIAPVIDRFLRPKTFHADERIDTHD